jgi:hypothetical protein
MRDAPYGSDWPTGSIISFSGERFRIRENYGSKGEVESIDGKFVHERFYWTYDGEKCELISKPSPTDFALPAKSCENEDAVYIIKGQAYRIGINKGFISVHNNYADAVKNKNAITKKGFDCVAQILTLENALNVVSKINEEVNHYEWLNENLNSFWLQTIGKSLSDSNNAGIIAADADKCDGYKKRWEKEGIPFPHGVAVYLLSKTGYFHYEEYVSPCDLVINSYLPLRELLNNFKL